MTTILTFLQEWSVLDAARWSYIHTFATQDSPFPCPGDNNNGDLSNIHAHTLLARDKSNKQGTDFFLVLTWNILCYALIKGQKKRMGIEDSVLQGTTLMRSI